MLDRRSIDDHSCLKHDGLANAAAAGGYMTSVEASAKRMGGGKLLVRWRGGHYSHARCYWGLVAPDAGADAARAQVLAEQRALFLGFADGAPNVVIVDDPAPDAPAERLRFVLVDSMTGAATLAFGVQTPGGAARGDPSRL